jgi:hypothetical protein
MARGWSPEARARAALARKIKNRFGEGAYQAFKRSGSIPAGLNSDPNAKVLKAAAKNVGASVKDVMAKVDPSKPTPTKLKGVAGPNQPSMPGTGAVGVKRKSGTIDLVGPKGQGGLRSAHHPEINSVLKKNGLESTPEGRRIKNLIRNGGEISEGDLAWLHDAVANTNHLHGSNGSHARQIQQNLRRVLGHDTSAKHTQSKTVDHAGSTKDVSLFKPLKGGAKKPKPGRPEGTIVINQRNGTQIVPKKATTKHLVNTLDQIEGGSVNVSQQEADVIKNELLSRPDLERVIATMTDGDIIDETLGLTAAAKRRRKSSK